MVFIIFVVAPCRGAMGRPGGFRDPRTGKSGGGKEGRGGKKGKRERKKRIARINVGKNTKKTLPPERERGPEKTPEKKEKDRASGAGPETHRDPGPPAFSFRKGFAGPPGRPRVRDISAARAQNDSKRVFSDYSETGDFFN
jgi:hypothetical protein